MEDGSNHLRVGYLKLNVDASFRDGSLAYGGLLRDDHGDWVWVWGFTGRGDGSDALVGELWALFHGLKIAVNRGLFRLVIEAEDSEHH